MLAELVATASVSCVNKALDMPNLPVIDLLAGWTSALGFDTQILPVPGHPGKANLVAACGRGTNGLVFSGHTDTVPCDPEKWDSDPFRLLEKDHKYFGLGTTDMKSFFAIVLDAISGIDLERLERPLLLLATADEETTMSGARALVNAAALPAARAVIGEPTGLKPVRAHKGMLSESLTVYGRAGHSSDPRNGNSALDGMHKVITALKRWHERLQQEFQDPRFQVPGPTMNLGYIKGGDNPNRICSECELQFDLRPLPGMRAETLYRQLHELVEQTLHGSGLQFRFRHLCEQIPAFEAQTSSALVELATRLTGAEPEAVAFATEAPFLRRLDCDTLVLGPGDIAQAHQANEYLAMASIRPMQRIVHELIRSCCVDEY